MTLVTEADRIAFVPRTPCIECGLFCGHDALFETEVFGSDDWQVVGTCGRCLRDDEADHGQASEVV